MRRRNIHTIRTDVMLHDTGFYYPTGDEQRAGFRALDTRSGIDRRGERMLHQMERDRRAA